MYDMSTVVTVRLDKKLAKSLSRLSKETGKSRSAIVRDALQRQLFLEDFARLRGELVPKATKLGIITDEDVFKIVS
jgi:predicted transcriptional regulator